MAGRIGLVVAKKVRIARRKRAERTVRIVLVVSVVFFAVVCLGPVPVAGIVGLIVGVFPTEDQGGLWGYTPGYPAFAYLAWLMFIPAIATLFLSIYTIPLPLKQNFAIRRGFLIMVAFLELLASPLVSLAFRDPTSQEFPIAIWTVPILAFALILYVLRALLGALKLVPESWRTEITTTPRTKAVDVSE